MKTQQLEIATTIKNQISELAPGMLTFIGAKNLVAHDRAEYKGVNAMGGLQFKARNGRTVSIILTADDLYTVLVTSKLNMKTFECKELCRHAGVYAEDMPELVAEELGYLAKYRDVAPTIAAIRKAGY